MTAANPTILLDEVDAVFAGDKSESAQVIRGVLNSGNRRGGSVPRVQTAGGQRIVERFNTFGPKALAGIRSLPETLADRSIEIRMRRKTKDEKVEAFRIRRAQQEVWPIRDDLHRSLLANRDAVLAWRLGDDADISGLSDRQIEGWEPLVAIAGAAGRDWLREALKAARWLSEAARERETPEGALLLMHCRDAFDEAGTDRLTTSQLLMSLRARDDGPWSVQFDENWDADGSKSAYKLAALLREYEVRPSKVQFRNGDQKWRAQGYTRAHFADAWRRWLPQLTSGLSELRPGA